MKESTDLRSLKINGHHYLFSTMNAEVSYTISVDTAQPELPVVEYDSSNRSDIYSAIYHAVNLIDTEKENAGYLGWQEQILEVCKDTKIELLQDLDNTRSEDSKFEENVKSAKGAIERMLNLYDKLMTEIPEYIEEHKGQYESGKAVERRIPPYDVISENIGCLSGVKEKSSRLSPGWLKEHQWSQCKEWDNVMPGSLSLEINSRAIPADAMVMIQNCRDKVINYVRGADECLAILNDSIVKNYENNLKNLDKAFADIKYNKNENKDDLESALNECQDIYENLKSMALHAVVEDYMDRFDSMKANLETDLRSLEELVDEYSTFLDIYSDFYAVFPEKVIEYRDWLQGVSDMIMSWEADYAGMIDENGGVMEFPSHIIFDGVDYAVFKIKQALDNGMKCTTVKLPETVRYLSYNSLHCSDIVRIESFNPVPPVMEDPYVFYFYFTDFNTDNNVSTYDKMTLIVPDGCSEAYLREETPLRGKNGYWWYLFKEIKTFSEANGVDSIEGDADGIYLDNGVLINETGAEIAIYDISGRIIYVGSEKEVTIARKGILIIKEGDKTIKLNS